MLKTTHIKIANNILDTIQANVDWKIHRYTYLFGSIAPDINFVFPAHTMKKTFKRFRNRLIRMDTINNTIIKSFTLGVITHYICDYFCYAHNMNKTDPKHAVYERCIRAHLKWHENILEMCGEELVKQWEEIKEHVIEGVTEGGETGKVIESITMHGMDHISYVIKTIEEMHDAYIEQTEALNGLDWFKSNIKIELDLEYSKFMCEKIALLILNPNVEMVEVYSK